MPELPEVETIVRGLRPHVVGRTIEALRYTWPRTLHTPDAPIFAARVAGQRVQAVRRRGKYVVLELSSDTLLIHLRMTGRLYVMPADVRAEADRWLRVAFALDDGRELRFSDVRKFGRCYLLDDPARILGRLGPEPLGPRFTVAVFRRQLAGRRRKLKPALLDQRVVAGVGNIYADEALFFARLHPLRRVDTLSAAETERLHKALQHVLLQGLAREGASVDWYRKADGTRGSAQEALAVYGRAGQPCPRCGHPVERIVVAQRGTHFCPRCQPLPKELTGREP